VQVCAQTLQPRRRRTTATTAAVPTAAAIAPTGRGVCRGVAVGRHRIAAVRFVPSLLLLFAKKRATAAAGTNPSVAAPTFNPAAAVAAPPLAAVAWLRWCCRSRAAACRCFSIDSTHAGRW
jgi:hypothetical protein